jgi:hypothetical protein
LPETIQTDYRKLIEPLTDEIISLCKENRFTFLMDDTDKDWFNYREIYPTFTSSLVSAVGDLNANFNYGSVGPKIIAFIRSDLFLSIQNIPQ